MTKKLDQFEKSNRRNRRVALTWLKRILSDNKSLVNIRSDFGIEVLSFNGEQHAFDTGRRVITIEYNEKIPRGKK